MNCRSKVAESPRVWRRPNGVSGGPESYQRVPTRMWERLWYQFAQISKLSSKINEINCLPGDPYGRRTAAFGRKPIGGL